MEKVNKIEATKKLQDALKQGIISGFVYKTAWTGIKNLTDESLILQAYNDAINMGKIINNSEDLQVYIGAQNLVPFFINKLGMKPNKKNMNHLLRKIVEEKAKTVEEVSQIVFDFMNNQRKVAYPSMISFKDDIVKSQDLNDWIKRISGIYNKTSRGFNRENVIDEFTQDMSSYEKSNFKQWLKHYEDGDYYKYNVGKNMNKQANISDPNYLETLNNLFNTKEIHKQREQDAKDKRNEARQKRTALKGKMLSRLRSLDKLLDQYFSELDLSADDNLDPNKAKQKADSVKQLNDQLTQLKSNLQQLSTVASSVDKMYKIGNMAKGIGFNKFANIIIKEAVELERSSRELDHDSAEPSKNLAGMKESFNGRGNIENIKDSANPLVILDKLEILSHFLGERSLIRELAEVDIMLHELGMAAYFPELAEAQSKLIDSFTYASRKIEESISKIRGGLEQSKKKEYFPPAPPKPPKVSVPTGKVDIKMGEPPPPSVKKEELRNE